MDRISTHARSALMGKVKAKNTLPEIVVRRLLHRLGYRFRLHRKELPGTPDIVLPARRKVIFVNGCFWHGHSCKYGRLPKSRLEFWEAKIATNQRRDTRCVEELERAGWNVLVVWQCQCRHALELEGQLLKFLE